MRASEAANVKKRWREQHDDVLFPDEVRLLSCFYNSTCKDPSGHLVSRSADPDTSTCHPFMWTAGWIEQPNGLRDQDGAVHVQWQAGGAKCSLLMQVDTPADIAARTRFGKFRGLRSWRTSAWDPKENLPREYARVFAFQNPTRAQKRCLPCQLSFSIYPAPRH